MYISCNREPRTHTHPRATPLRLASAAPCDCVTLSAAYCLKLCQGALSFCLPSTQTSYFWYMPLAVNNSLLSTLQVSSSSAVANCRELCLGAYPVSKTMRHQYKERRCVSKQRKGHCRTNGHRQNNWLCIIAEC